MHTNVVPCLLTALTGLSLFGDKVNNEINFLSFFFFFLDTLVSSKVY